MNPTIWTAIKPIASQAARDFLRTVGTALAAHGYITGGAGTEAFIGAGMTLAGLFWGWFTTSGYLQLAGLLKKLTATKTQAAAVTAAQVLPPAAAVDTSIKAATVASVAKVLLLAFALGFLAFPHGASAQTSSDPFGLNKFLQSPVVKALQQWPIDDINGAETMSISIPNLQDPVGQVCWQQFQAMGAIVKQHQLPLTFKAAQDLEAARLFTMAIKNVCKNPSCTQMFADLSNQIGAFTPIPTGLSLSSICSKIP